MDLLVEAGGRDIALAPATVATVGAAIMIGLGFVARPTRPALLWSLAFVVAMLCTFGTIVAEVTASEIIRNISQGVLMAAPALIWSGFRARGERRTFAWIAFVQAAASAGALLLAEGTVWFSVAFRIVFLAAAVFAGLTVWESRRIPERNDRLLLPLVLVSAAFLALGFFTAVAGLLFPPTLGDDLVTVRTFNAFAILVYLVCALVSLISLVLGVESGQIGVGSWRSFVAAASDRLRRAEANDERSWSLIEFRLDDIGNIRDAGGLTSFAAIVDRFEAAVRGAFPAEADIGRESPGRVFVLVARPNAVVRIAMRSALDRVSRLDRNDPLEVQLYASAGWASTEGAGYDFPALRRAAGGAADTAARSGGDRWSAAGVATTG